MNEILSSPSQLTRTVTEFPVAELVERARILAENGERRLLGIAGAPGAGKSTLSAALMSQLGDTAVLIGMDSFHLSNAELLRLGRRDRKGAPDTFDVDGYVALLQRVRHQDAGTIYAPEFDRSIEESIAGVVPVHATASLVITEGNYLLLDNGGWEKVREELDEVWFIDIPSDLRRQRLVDRRVSHGDNPENATLWVNTVDEANAQLVERTRSRADMIVRVINAPV